jgi:fatty-acyl-CoA synthase
LIDRTNAARRLFELLRQGSYEPASALAYSFMSAHDDLRTYTRREIFDRADEVADRLSWSWRRVNGPDPGLVAILSSSQETQVVHVLAALSAGLVPAVLTPLNRKLDRTWYMKNAVAVLKDVAPGLILTNIAGELAAVATDGGLPTLAELDTCTIVGRADHVGRRLDAGTAFVQFSSGTTGIKKGVAIGLPAIRSQLLTYGQALALQPTSAVDGERVVSGDCIVSWLPLYHDMGFVTALLLPLFAGVYCIMLDPIDWVGAPLSYLEAVTRFGATLGWHPNFAFALMAARAHGSSRVERLDLSSLRALVNCAEPVTAAAQLAFAASFSAVGLSAGVFAGSYAMAEATFALTHAFGTDLDGMDAAGPLGTTRLDSRLPMVSVGSPLRGVTLEIRDAADRPLDDRRVGEIWVRAPFLADGYLGGARETSRAFMNGWYRTGDLGYRIGDRLYVAGRAKDVLIVAGQNIYPDDVERLISSRPGVHPGRVVAFAVFDEGIQSERVVVVAEPEADPSEFDSIGAAQMVMSALQIAVTVELVERGWLVKSSAGKIARLASAAKWRGTSNPSRAGAGDRPVS